MSLLPHLIPTTALLIRDHHYTHSKEKKTVSKTQDCLVTKMCVLYRNLGAHFHS